MRKRMIAVVLVLVLLLAMLTGCGPIRSVLDSFYEQLQNGFATSFEDMVYTRPDTTDFSSLQAELMQQIPNATDADDLMRSVLTLYQYYYDFSTNYYLANIHYYLDVTDIYWEEEYSWCMEKSTIYSAGMDRLLYALADCPIREDLEADRYFGPDFFDMYEGESLWDDTFTELMNQETALMDQYYELNAQTVDVEYYSEEYFTGLGAQIEEVYVDLVAIRQEIARYAGYEDYPSFAYDFYFYRDYEPEQAVSYIEQIQQELVPMYQNLSTDVWAPMQEKCELDQTFSYVRDCAEAMGGTARSAFSLMETAKLYNIDYSENKYDASFEVYLMNYHSPFVFVNPSLNQGDQLTFAHEFGHFCNDYATGGAGKGIDVAEIFSQGMEYLSLCYYEGDTEDLTRMKMAESLCVFVEQSAYAWFEHEVYALEGEELTVENVRALYQQATQRYGFTGQGRDAREYTLIPHIFISPMYVISYVVSNDVAMQIYQMELTEQGSGLAAWEEGLYSLQIGLLGFVEEMEFSSPFTDGAVAKMRETLEEKLK